MTASAVSVASVPLSQPINNSQFHHLPLSFAQHKYTHMLNGCCAKHGNMHNLTIHTQLMLCDLVYFR